MLTVLRDREGRLEAACEWTPVDQHGTPSNTGRWVWVNQVELSQGVQSRMVWRDLIAIIALLAPSCIGAYWHRRDKTGRSLHPYTRTQLLTYVQKEVRV